ncbi:M48 family metallopeptidase [Halobaculum rubrum]|uniref:M48 family metallopeptidase n=1 Tax=Halobaculum rubrum TaxID=2872158 RepID=UPI001CA3CD4F|nr:SprT family zinc-dependent metalloprotease [Halobaculum rubrum]QZX99392.1 M48 family metallopeptidase [Halobaculum rubrum]
MANSPVHEIDLLGESVEYEVRYSPDATEPRLDVDIHGVTVTLPESTESTPTELLQENAVWVTEKKRRYDSFREQIPERRFIEGEDFPYLGEDREVIVERRPSSEVDEETFRLAEHHVEDTSLKRALESLYRRKARERFESRAESFAVEMGVSYEQIEVRNQRTKWGSCSTSGTLGLNWRLMMAPPEIIDYIVVHELAHLRESSHGDKFWSLVGEYDPEYKDHAQWLEQNSTKLMFSEDDL